MQHDPDKIKDLIVQWLSDKKAEEVVSLDLSNKSFIADYMVIATAQSNRQLYAISYFLWEELKKLNIPAHLEGASLCDWVLIDSGFVIINLFKPEARKFYNLEKMWGLEIPQQ